MLGFAISVPSDWLHPTTNFQSYGLVFSLRLPRLSLGMPQVCLVAFSSQHSCSLFMHAQLNTPLHACSLNACFWCICAKLVWTHAPSIHSTKHPKWVKNGTLGIMHPSYTLPNTPGMCLVHCYTCGLPHFSSYMVHMS